MSPVRCASGSHRRTLPAAARSSPPPSPSLGFAEASPSTPRAANGRVQLRGQANRQPCPHAEGQTRFQFDETNITRLPPLCGAGRATAGRVTLYFDPVWFRRGRCRGDERAGGQKRPPRPFVTLESHLSDSHRCEIQSDTAGGGGSRAAQGWAASDVGLLTLKLRSPLCVWPHLETPFVP